LLSACTKTHPCTLKISSRHAIATTGDHEFSKAMRSRDACLRIATYKNAYSTSQQLQSRALQKDLRYPLCKCSSRHHMCRLAKDVLLTEDDHAQMVLISHPADRPQTRSCLSPSKPTYFGSTKHYYVVIAMLPSAY